MHEIYMEYKNILIIKVGELIGRCIANIVGCYYVTERISQRLADIVGAFAIQRFCTELAPH